jgi:putative oxidoreductase
LCEQRAAFDLQGPQSAILRPPKLQQDVVPTKRRKARLLQIPFHAFEQLLLGPHQVDPRVRRCVTFGLAGTAGYFESIGLPAWLAYATFVAEAIGGVMLVLGIYSRWAAVALIPALIGAIIWAHGANGWVFTAPNGGWEYPLYLIVLSIAQFLLGDGALALRPSRTPAALWWRKHPCLPPTSL